MQQASVQDPDPDLLDLGFLAGTGFGSADFQIQNWNPKADIFNGFPAKS